VNEGHTLKFDDGLKTKTFEEDAGQHIAELCRAEISPS